MKSLIKDLLLKRREKLNPSENGEEQGLLAMLADGPEVEEEKVLATESDKEEGSGEKKPLTLEVEEEKNPNHEQDLAPGVPSEPVDKNASEDDIKGALIDAIMGGYSEDEVKARHGGLTLRGKMRQNALKMK